MSDLLIISEKSFGLVGGISSLDSAIAKQITGATSGITAVIVNSKEELDAALEDAGIENIVISNRYETPLPIKIETTKFREFEEPKIKYTAHGKIKSR